MEIFFKVNKIKLNKDPPKLQKYGFKAKNCPKVKPNKIWNSTCNVTQLLNKFKYTHHPDAKGHNRNHQFRSIDSNYYVIYFLI